jgi:hypothetical protein
MRGVSLLVLAALWAGPAQAQQAPIRASLEKGAEAAAQQASTESKTRAASGRKSPLFWTGLAVSVAGVTTSALGLTALRTESTSTGNAPDETYRNCVALRDSNPIYASSQCGALKGKNLKLLWGGVGIAGAGAALMITGHGTSAQLSPQSVGVFHRWQF